MNDLLALLTQCLPKHIPKPKLKTVDKNRNYRAICALFLICLAIFLPYQAYSTSCSNGIIYVDADANGNNNGTSWANAFNNLQDALMLDRNAPTDNDIWVAEGTYYPSDNGDRAASFKVYDGLVLYGGFAGTETSLSERNLDANPTILDGDIGTSGLNTDNSYHVVLAENITDPNTTINGFVIQNGQADGSGLFGYGGGFLNYNSNSASTSYYRIAFLTFTHNYATRGGGLSTYAENVVHDSLIIENCFFDANSAASGGAVYNYKGFGSQLECSYQNCAFSNNTASGFGGAGTSYGREGQIINELKCNVKYIGCSFWNNSARSGGALALGDNASSLSSLVRNCSFYGNEATQNGDAVLVLDNGKLLMGNCILWNGSSIHNGAVIFEDDIITVNNSLVENGGGGNFDDYPDIDDPGFADPDNGDLHISACSDLIDRGANYGLPISLDMDGNARMVGPKLDLGSYEYNGNPVGLPIPAQPSQQVVATLEVTDTDGWTHYYTCDDPSHLIFSIFKDGQEIGNLGEDGFEVRVSTTGTLGQGGLNKSTADYLPSGVDGWLVFNRYWEVANAIPLSAPTNVRFYFTDADFQDIQDGLLATGTPPLNDLTELQFYTITGANPLATDVIQNGGSYTPLVYDPSPSASHWTFGQFNGKWYAEFVVNSLEGGSAGAESVSPLPVEFKSFTAELQEDNQVLLEWITESETNNDYFMVERSTDAKQFYPLLVHDSQGNGEVIRSYTDWDYTPQKGINYYRVKQVDFDGQYSYSSIASVIVDSGQEEAVLYPNPSSGQINLQLPAGIEGKVRLQLWDVMRRVVWEEELSQADGIILQRNFSHLSPGTYTFKIQAKRYRSYHPVVITKLD